MTQDEIAAAVGARAERIAEGGRVEPREAQFLAICERLDALEDGAAGAGERLDILLMLGDGGRYHALQLDVLTYINWKTRPLAGGQEFHDRMLARRRAADAVA